MENDLTDLGMGVEIEWFEVFISDAATGERIDFKNFLAVTDGELAALMRKAEGIAASMNDEDMLREGLDAPIAPEKSESGCAEYLTEDEDDALPF